MLSMCHKQEKNCDTNEVAGGLISQSSPERRGRWKIRANEKLLITRRGF